MAAEAAAAAAGAGPLGAIMGGLGLVGQIGSFFGARSARKKQERCIKKMMADRAARIAEAKGEYDKSRRGLQAENRGAMLAALKGVPASLGASLMQGSTAANAMRSIYADAQRRSAEIGRQTAAGKAELAMLSPYDIVDPSTMGQSRGAEMQALSGLLGGIANFGTSLYNAYGQQATGQALSNLGAATQGMQTTMGTGGYSYGGNLPNPLSGVYSSLGQSMQANAFGKNFGK